MAELVAPIVADDPAAPTLAAISGSNIVVMFGEQPGRVFTTNGTNRGEVNLRIEDIGVSSVDLAGGQLLAAFGEAAMVTNIDTGERYVATTPNGWVVDAVWGTAPEPALPDFAADRCRVNSAMVEADKSDPYLNVRMGPGTSSNILAKLPPTYTGLRWTGEEQTTDDGAIWYQVTLLDPVATTPGEPLEGRNPVGWVNSAFLEFLPQGLPVTLDEVPACVDHIGDIAAVRGSHPASGIYALESAYLSAHCLRVVVTFGSGEMPFTWDVARNIVPADSVPEVLDVWNHFSLGGIDTVWQGAGQTSDGVYVVDTGDGLELWALQYPQRATLTALPDRGILVVDLYLQDELVSFPAVENVVLTSEPITGSEAVVVTGIARTFQGQLGMRTTGSSGSLVSAVYSGSLTTGTTETTKYAVQIPDRYPVWYPFVMQVEGLSPGDYTVFVDPGGGVAGFWRPLRLPISVDETDLTGSPDWRAGFVGPPPLATEEEQDIVRSLMRFAGGEVPLSAVPFADQVMLGLNTVDFRARSRAELSDRDAWKANVEEFDGIGGDFNALDALSRLDFVRVTAGPIPHCAGPPLQWPVDLEQSRQINIEPIGIDSCMQWAGVSIFLNDDNQITAVVVDYYGP